MTFRGDNRPAYLVRAAAGPLTYRSSAFPSGIWPRLLVARGANPDATPGPRIALPPFLQLSGIREEGSEDAAVSADYGL